MIISTYDIGFKSYSIMQKLVYLLGYGHTIPSLLSEAIWLFDLVVRSKINGKSLILIDKDGTHQDEIILNFECEYGD